MLDWDLRLDLDSQPGPMYLRVAAAIAEGIRSGRLREGAPLPGTRRLARSLGVHRNTILAAFRELASEGLIDARPSQGTFVAEPSEPGPIRRAVPDTVAFDLRRTNAGRACPEPLPPGTLELSHLPSPSEVPGVPLARAYRRAVRREAPEVLDYANRTQSGATLGDPRLRRALAEMLSRTRGLAVGPKDVLVTSGSQMALYLIAQALIEPGDVIAVESFGYRPVWEAFRLAGATLVPIPVDGEGLCVDRLREVALSKKIRAVYVTPHHQHPTAVTLTAARRRDLLGLATSNGIAIIEDDYDCDFAYDGRTVLPMASADRNGSVIYVGSLAKVLAPGLRIGYAVAPPPVLELMAERRSFIDRQGDHALARAVAELLDDGDLRRHVQRMHVTYRARRNALAEALQRELGDVVGLNLPSGGTALWARVADGVDVERWHGRSRDRGVVFCTGRSFAFADGPCQFARFGYASLEEPELRLAARRLATALPSSRNVT